MNAARFRPAWLVSGLTLTMSGYHLWAGWFGEPIAEIYRPVHLGFVLLIVFWTTGNFGQGWRRIPALVRTLVFSGLAVAACAYLVINAEIVQTRMVYFDPLSKIEIVLALGLIAAILEAARRTVGWILVALVLVFILYAAFGYNLPYPFWHRGYSLGSILETAYLTQDGIWGIPVGVTASYIFLFVLFGSFLLASGAGEFFSEFARALTGRTTGGPAKTAVVSSALMGMLSGSSAANVVTTGSFTIPAMKRAGYRSDFAAGVEAVASAGGQFAPPVMGAAAFIMIEFVGVSYLTIIKAATIPAVLYFIAVFCMVDLEARRLGLRLMPGEVVPAVWSVVKWQGYLFLTVSAMIYALIEGYTPTTAGLWAIITLVVLLLLLDARNRRRFHRICIKAMDHAPRLIAPVSIACAVGGIIVGVITQTGLGLRMSTIVLAMSGDSLLMLLFLTMIVGIILGMGMPTSGAYIILAALIAPGLVSFGVPILAAHMFILYCAGTSSITPPVAIASYAAAAVSGSNPWRTSMMAFRLGLSSYIIPYAFVFGPELLTIGTPLQVLTAFLTAMIGVASLSVALIGWLFVDLRLWNRALFLVGAPMLIVPHLITDLAGLLLISGAAFASYYLSRQGPTRTELSERPLPE